MKQLTAKQKIFYIIIIAIILAGISVICTIGFNLGTTYSNSKRIDIYIGKDFSLNDIRSIADNVFNENVVIQTAKKLDDTVSITVKNATDEQVEELKTKISEKYNVLEKFQSATTTEIPATNVFDVINPYIFPVVLATFIYMLYLAIRYIRQNAFKICGKVLGSLIVVEVLYFSIIAITRIPFNDFIMPIALLIYILTSMKIACSIENKMKIKNNKEQK